MEFSQADGRVETDTATTWLSLFSFDVMIFLLVLVRTVRDRERGPLDMSGLSELVFRDGAYSSAPGQNCDRGFDMTRCHLLCVSLFSSR